MRDRCVYLQLSQSEGTKSQLRHSCRTWDVIPFILDVHLVQASLGGLVLDGDCAVLVVSDMGAGGLA